MHACLASVVSNVRVNDSLCNSQKITLSILSRFRVTELRAPSILRNPLISRTRKRTPAGLKSALAIVER